MSKKNKENQVLDLNEKLQIISEVYKIALIEARYMLKDGVPTHTPMNFALMALVKAIDVSDCMNEYNEGMQKIYSKKTKKTQGTQKRKPGRPKGAKNKPKQEAHTVKE